jgi:hypothetical protein
MLHNSLFDSIMRRTLLIVAALVLGLASSAHADPIIVGSGFSPPELSGLLAETVLVAILLAIRKLDFVRVLYTWFVITLVTYWLMMGCAAFAIEGLMEAFPKIDDGPEIAAVTVFFVLEVCVVFVETWYMRRLSCRRFFQNNQTPLGWKYALLVSLCGNVVSVLVGFAWLTVVEPYLLS